MFAITLRSKTHYSFIINNFIYYKISLRFLRVSEYILFFKQ